jgi:hypothetical protein
MRQRFIWIVGIAAFFLIRLSAQQKLPPDDPRLYLMFFDFHNSLMLAVENKKAKDPEGGARTEKAVAQVLKVQLSELQKVTDTAHAFVGDRAKWQNDLKSYVDATRARNQEPDTVMLAQFGQQRQELIANAVQQLRTGLSPAGWTGLQSYINNEYRRHISVAEFKSSK